MAWWIPAGVLLGVAALDALLDVRLPDWAGAVLGGLCFFFLVAFSIIGVIACGSALFARRWRRAFALLSLGLLSLFLFTVLLSDLVAASYAQAIAA